MLSELRRATMSKQEQIAQIEADIREYQELIIANDCEDIGKDMMFAFALDRLQRQLRKVKYSRKVK
jgi:ribosome-associated translation inhibitor RaiA